MKNPSPAAPAAPAWQPAVVKTPQPERAALPVPADRPLLSEAGGAAVADAFGALTRTMLAQSSRSLEDVVGEMLQPMLRIWLDDNLPAIVERLVRDEIERVSRGRS